ncbi:MAG: hypothetical protein ACXWNN_13650 [Candidatus Binataceae bacterium]
MRHHTQLSLRQRLTWIAMMALAVIFSGATAFAAEGRKGADPTVAELQRALDVAAREARGADNLDPAYQLLTLADTAQQFRAPQIVAGAGAVFSELIARTTATALRRPAVARDALDQFVDLRSAAFSSPTAQEALDKGMGTLFPAVVGGLEQAIANSVSWDEKLTKTADLGQLQASATQVKMAGIASGIGTAFDAHITALRASADNESDTALRDKRRGSVDEAIRSRADHVADAAANNVDVLASRIQSSPGEGQPGPRQTITAKD